MRTRPVVAALPLALLLLSWAAPAASAAQFKSNNSPVVYYGVQAAGQTNKFTVDGQNASCPNASYESAATVTPANTVKVTPVYSAPMGQNCTVFGLVSPTEIKMNGCEFQFLQPNMSLESNMGIICPTGKSIKIFGESFFSTCEVAIGEAGNANRAKVKFANLAGAPTKIEAKFEVTGITATKVKDNGLCPLAGAGNVNTASYTASVIFEGKMGIEVSIS